MLPPSRDGMSRDPFVDRARSVYLYAVVIIVLVNYVALPLAGLFGMHAEPISLAALSVVVAPAVVFMFGKSWEQIKKAVRP
ncbi:putative membrane protein [Asticcacaulis biprosthecium C19]|uniref:Putative membrane protein n=1 Tax=Asticcacaulis biprosthecium C19 TaxID=715226 RepID=F4QGB4_9CAUL|nr:putative membrane protein [Asticcacaulis biprosthecium C19]